MCAVYEFENVRVRASECVYMVGCVGVWTHCVRVSACDHVVVAVVVAGGGGDGRGGDVVAAVVVALLLVM